jgi:Ca-activated chloride channel family protein
MHKEDSLFALVSRHSAPAPVLAGVSAVGRLDGVLFELTLRQTYRNTCDQNLEVVYTFPLPSQAVLLGFASELNGSRMVGTIVATPQAEQQYERALSEGDAPVMLEVLPEGGLHTANIGNLKPGDELVIEMRYAQTLEFEQGRLRLSIPTTIAPRYGNAERAGLQAQQVPLASIEAEYPLALSVTVSDVLAGAGLEYPTHRFEREMIDRNVRLTLAQGARLDRDVVILIQPREARPSLLIQADDPASNTVVRMAAFQPAVAIEREHIALKLLVDCSGSMGGDSIASARGALCGVADGLRAGDTVSLSRFGSHVEHLLAPTVHTVAKAGMLPSAIPRIVADMGGTEMEAALRAVIALKVPSSAQSADVLMITDGEVWQAREMIDAARASGHRVFVIGVGTSPAESMLRSLAEATGGACEFATPGEALEAAAQRMLPRIRQPVRSGLRIDWGAEPLWRSMLPVSAFGGDTLIAFAGFSAATKASPARLLAMDDHDEQIELAGTEANAPCPGDNLARIAAAGRMVTGDEETALALAVQYQLLTERTSCILVHERAAADKAIDESTMYQVQSMLAAGWGATSAAAEEAFMGHAGPEGPPAALSMRCGDGRSLGHLGSSLVEPAPDSLTELAFAVYEHLACGGNVADLASRCQPIQLHPDVYLGLEQVAALGVGYGNALLLLAMWVNARHHEFGDPSIATVLQPWVELLDADLLLVGTELFARLLGGHPRVLHEQRPLKRSAAGWTRSGLAT